MTLTYMTHREGLRCWHFWRKRHSCPTYCGSHLCNGAHYKRRCRVCCIVDKADLYEEAQS
jgi:hypothetical protein